MKNYTWNMFANIKNGQMARKKFIIHRYKKICRNFLNILWDEGFILGYKIDHNILKIFLKYNNSKPVINTIKLISKPGHKIYYRLNQLWKMDDMKGLIIISTNKGLMSLKNCKKYKLGGKPFIIVK